MSDYKIGIGCGVSNGIHLDVVRRALQVGIRYFDTSTFYAAGALKEIEKIIGELGIDRGEVHLCMKLWMDDLGPNRSSDYAVNRNFFRDKIVDLRSTYNGVVFDSIALHYPLKVDEEGIPDEFIIEEIWPQLEILVNEGVIKEIGVSNFNIVEMQRLLDIARVMPYSAQIEFNPFCHDDALVDFCEKKGIMVVGHSPFSFGWSDGHLALFENPVIKEIASAYDVPPPQLILSWAMAKGVVPIPGTTKAEHVQDFRAAEDLSILTEQDIQRIDGLNKKNFHYLGMYDYFGKAAEKRYFEGNENIRASVYEDGVFSEISIFDHSFMPSVKNALTFGAGFVVLPEIFAELAAQLQNDAQQGALNSADRWNGMGPNINSVLNSGSAILQILDDPLLSLVVQSVLGWDCKLDNISLSTSRVAPNNSVFGPHQDSPFDNNPGAPLPPPSYPLVLQVIVALDEFTEDNGPIYIIPHSHKRRSRVLVPWQGNLAPGQIPEHALKVIVPKGSAIIAVGHIWHGTFANVSSSPRMGLLIEYVCSVCDARDKFTVDSFNSDRLQICSRRVIRLLGNGKRHQHDNPALLEAYKEARRANIPSFAVRC